MQWFEGSIVEAIAAAKSANAIFVVYVHDSSETSSQSELVLNDSEVSSLLSSRQFVAIKLENGTDGAKQFSQIYPLVLVPSLFFISGQSGVPLEIVGGTFARDDLMKKLQKLNPTCEQDNSPISSSIDNQETQASESTEMKETSDLKKNSSVEASSTTKVDTTNAISSAEAPTTQPLASEDIETSASSSQEEIGDQASNIPLDERLERAKVLLDEKAAQKQKEHEEDQRRKETERRQVGKDMAKQRQLQHEEELKSAAQERKKDKQDDRLARERVKAQIAADRAEREARNAALRGEQANEKSAAQPDTTAAASASAFASQSSPSVCRIKFRLPDGSSSVAQFPPKSSLRTVREHVTNNIAVPFRTFEMTSTMRPQPFSQDDLDRSLTDLDLVPSAILIITPGSTGRGSSVMTASDGSMLSIFWLVLSPITIILGWLRILFGGTREQPRDPRQDKGFRAEEPVSKKPREGSSTTRNRPKTAYGSHQEGNIHRFTNKDDNDDDDDKTWNGNSTQQM